MVRDPSQRSRGQLERFGTTVLAGIALALASVAVGASPDATPTVGDAVQLFPMQVPPLESGSLSLRGDGYGSSLYPVPGSPDEVYGLTDRGPNVFLPDGTVVEPLPAFQPAIGKFRLQNGAATLEQTIPLADSNGAPYSGRVNAQNPRGQRILDLDGTPLPTDPNGYDPEGLVAMPDGTFWVSDEYGPFITHFDAAGRQIGRLSPFDGTLPLELANRIGNRGLEGLALTPDGSTLVAIMQSALQQPDLGGADAMRIGLVRIVTYELLTGALHEYLYLLDDPATNRTAVSEIAALTNHTFVVDERDGAFPPHAYKKLWRVDLAGATDVGPHGTVAGARYDAAGGGLLVDGHTLEALIAGQDTRAAAATLREHGITPVSKFLALDLGALLDRIDPQGRVFSHDKIEGLSVDLKGQRIILSNDDDFGIGGVASPTPPFRLTDKVSPATGKQDAGEFMIIDAARLPGLGVSTEITGSPTGTPTASRRAHPTPPAPRAKP
jgi:hypothetical protein